MQYNIELYNEVIKDNTDKEEDFCDYERCAACAKDDSKMTCCVGAPCELDASDFEVTYENVMKLLNSGLVVMDKWEPDGASDYKEVWFLRMRAKEDMNYKVCLGWGSKCALLTENGCPIPFKKRAYYGRRSNCWTGGYNSKCASMKSFMSYQDTLLEVLDDLPIAEVSILSMF